ncbi:MAG: elongation factor P lysine(34) lysyltransferase [Planctomycetota bacterium]|nr:MAG: elongation factor P lysine(34) lysyltransferase [Planctomycetota bacterium]
MSAADWAPRATPELLARRAALRQGIRAHFAGNALEVEVPILQGGPNRDHGVAVARSGDHYLTTSPEHPLKRLVSAGYGSVWCFHPCLRPGESGRLHRPAFTMLEWYRPGWSLAALRDECVQLIAGALGRPLELQVLSWQQAMALVCGAPPDELSLAALAACCPDAPPDCSRAEFYDLIFASRVQPQLGHGGISAVEEWPASACAQARIAANAQGQPVALRCELFVDGVELVNAYDECWNADELRQRFSAHAEELGERAVHDERFLACLAHNPGPVSGAALGFDRLVALACGCNDIGDTMAFPWEIA